MYATGIKMWEMMAFSEYRTGYFSERTLLEQTAFLSKRRICKILYTDQANIIFQNTEQLVKAIFIFRTQNKDLPSFP